MQRLVILRLRSNNFSGHIPIEITWLFSLRILDLANNTFSGVMPRSLENLKALTTTVVVLDIKDNPFRELYRGQSNNDSLSLVIKGQVLEYKENAIYFMSIDLSCNRLVGQIPEELSSLLGLVNLNLSSNFLSGNIPYKIGNLQLMESLDLSNNQLSGEIPRGLSDLTSLSYLNLSYNNLSGTIPSGHQLDTLKTDDPASMYIGNPGLCGHPLPKACPGDNPTQEDLARWHEADSTHTDFHLGFTVGFLAGLWIIFCGLLFKETWRYAYFSLFDKLYDKVPVFFLSLGNNGSENQVQTKQVL
ncbi:putative receptor like protein 25 [Panicum virgatum]|uniref:putative receptor like protein 25 n=1 Tax=Panicum virgatum TaxID=38727 RepID=UPI0019D5799B|nr:putative receptor like protein 25 [Panicum virgatum]